MANLTDKFKTINPDETDPRTRRYLTPVRVVTLRGDVKNADTLLEQRTNQITLGGGVGCELHNGKGGERAGVLVDFGREFNGAARVMVWGVSGASNRADLQIRFGESVMEALTPLGVKNTTNDHADRDVVMNVGFYSANETNETGFRFLYVELLNDDTTVLLKALKGVMIYRDIDYVGSFECDDTLLNKIWNTAAYTAHMNMQEYLWDGIKRDRLVWIGDMHTEVLTILAAFGYNDVVPKSLDLVRDDTPKGSWMNGISSYSMWWILIHYEWYRYFGNYDYLNEQRDYMKALLLNLVSYVDENGSERLPENRFLDWPNNANPEAIHAGLQGLLKITLERGAYLMKVLKEAEACIKCETAAFLMGKHQPESAGSKQAASLLSLSGLRDAKEINDELSVDGAKGYSTFFGFYTLAAKAKAGDYEGAMNDIKEYWGGMLGMGATTFWEDFDLDWLKNAGRIDEIVPEGKIDIHGDYGAYCYIKFRHSLSHGWASGPCPWLSRYVLGVEVTEPGFKKVKIIPHLGNLHYAKGTYPTPYGAIEITHMLRDDGTIKSEIFLPDEIELEI